MKVSKEGGTWKNWAIGVLVLVIVVMLFWKPGVMLGPEDEGDDNSDEVIDDSDTCILEDLEKSVLSAETEPSNTVVDRSLIYNRCIDNNPHPDFITAALCGTIANAYVTAKKGCECSSAKKECNNTNWPAVCRGLLKKVGC
jgi:hypothetical protein